MSNYHLDHLQHLETEAIHVMREVAGEFERPALLFSGGKDSICLLRLAEKAFRPAELPTPLLNVDTGHHFPELNEFRDRRAKQLGAKLIAGRDFKPEEMQTTKFGDRPRPDVAIVSKALADKLFPDGNAVGRQVYLDEDPPTTTIVGVVDRMQEPWVSSDDIEHALFMPIYMPYGNSTRYLVRTEPGRRDEVMKQVEQKLTQANPSRIIGKLRTIEQTRKEAYANDRAMAIVLGGVIAALLIITALGIVGMASFWVAQRTRQIGTRRALGATRFDILRYFLTENFLITTLGVIVGSVLTYGFNYWLITNYQAQRMPVVYLIGGIVALWLLGQIAVLGPARRASNVPPAVATRSV